MTPAGYALIFGLAFFFVGVCVVAAWLFLEQAPRRKESAPHILQADAVSAIGALAAVLEKIRFTDYLRRLIREADLDWSAGRVVLLMLTAFAVVLALLMRWDFVPWWGAIGVAVAAGSGPLLRVRHIRAKRLERVENQLPEALDFISRALIAGHSLPMSLELLADEIGPPLATELRKAVDEYNLGSSMEQALENFSDRVPSVDIRFFTSAIGTQSRTGGNLHDVLENLAETIRQRGTLKGQIRAMTANGRMTALILATLPFVIGGVMMLVNADLFMVLVRHPVGKTLLFLGLCSQAAAFFVIRKIVDIRV